MSPASSPPPTESKLLLSLALINGLGFIQERSSCTVALCSFDNSSESNKRLSKQAVDGARWFNSRRSHRLPFAKSRLQVAGVTRQGGNSTVPPEKGSVNEMLWSGWE